jgi:hypothetical protein
MEGEEAGKHERNPPPFLALKTQKGNHESRKVIAQGKEGREGGREERRERKDLGSTTRKFCQ